MYHETPENTRRTSSRTPRRALTAAVAVLLTGPVAFASAPPAAFATTPAPVIITQPTHAVALLNNPVTLSIGVDPATPADTIVWKTRGSSGEYVIGRGASYTINNLTKLEHHDHPFWAEVSNAGGTPTKSEERMFAVVERPVIVAPLLAGTMYGSQGVPAEFTVSATGGYANVARVVPEISITVPGGSISADRVHGPRTDTTVQAGTLMTTSSTQPVSVAFPSTFTVVWKTCVMVEGSDAPCPVEVPGARTTDANALSSTWLEPPKITGDLLPVTTAAPGQGLQLGVVLEASAARPSYLWETSSDGVSWSAAIDPDERFLRVGNVSEVDGTWYRVTVSNDSGSATSVATQVRASFFDQAEQYGKRYNLWFFNETTGPDGNHPITLIGSSGSTYAPTGFVQLQSSQGIRVVWDQATRFDMKIDASWTVRIRPGYDYAYCEFKRTGSSFWGSSPDYACVDSSGEEGLHWQGPSHTEGRLYLVRKPIAGATMVYTGKAAASLASVVCPHSDIHCVMKGNITDTEMMVTSRSEVGANCSLIPASAAAPTWFWVVSTLTSAHSSTFSEGWSVNAAVGVKLEKKPASGTADLSFTYQKNWSESSTEEITDSYQLQIGLMPGQKAFIANYVKATTMKGTISFVMAGQKYELRDAQITTFADSAVTGKSYLQDERPPYLKNTVVYVVQMDRDGEWAECAAKVSAADPIYRF